MNQSGPTTHQDGRPHLATPTISNDGAQSVANLTLFDWYAHAVIINLEIVSVSAIEAYSEKVFKVAQSLLAERSKHIPMNE